MPHVVSLVGCPVGAVALIRRILLVVCVFARFALAPFRVAFLLVEVLGDTLEGLAVVIPFGRNLSLAAGGFAVGRIVARLALSGIGVLLRGGIFVAVRGRVAAGTAVRIAVRLIVAFGSFSVDARLLFGVFARFAVLLADAAFAALLLVRIGLPVFVAVAARLTILALLTFFTLLAVFAFSLLLVLLAILRAVLSAIPFAASLAGTDYANFSVFGEC